MKPLLKTNAELLALDAIYAFPSSTSTEVRELTGEIHCLGHLRSLLGRMEKRGLVDSIRSPAP